MGTNEIEFRRNKNAWRKATWVVTAPDGACEVGDFASQGGAGEVDGLAFGLASKEPWPHCRAKDLRRKMAG